MHAYSTDYTYKPRRIYKRRYGFAASLLFHIAMIAIIEYFILDKPIQTLVSNYIEIIIEKNNSIAINNNTSAMNASMKPQSKVRSFHTISEKNSYQIHKKYTKKLSEHIASYIPKIIPQEIKGQSLTLFIEIDNDGKVLSHSVYPYVDDVVSNSLMDRIVRLSNPVPVPPYENTQAQKYFMEFYF